MPVALVLAIAAASAAAQQGGDTQVHWWAGTWDEAFVEAQARNVPVMVVFIQDDEESSDQLANSIFREPAYVKLTRKTVAVLCAREFHGNKKDDVAGTTKAVCTKYGSTSCDAHQKLVEPARIELCGQEVRTPQHILVLPDKTVSGRIIDLAPASAFVEMIAKASKKIGRGLTTDDYQRVQALLREARHRVAQKEWAPALAAAREALKLSEGTPFAKEAQGVLETLNEEARHFVERAVEAEKAGDAVLALRTLESAIETFAGTDAVAAIRKEHARIKATKAGAEAARVLAKEKRAEPQVLAGLAAEKAKDYITARREYERAAKTAAGTPLEDRIKKRLAEFEADPDIKALFERADREDAASVALKNAQALMSAGNKDAAREALKRVIDHYPGTNAAETAKKRLEGLR